MNNFYVHLASNTEDESDNNNTNGNFVTKLSRKINLTNEWEVALTEISYTKSWYNVFEDQKISLLFDTYNLFKSKEEKTLKAGNYDIESFIYHINEQLKLFKKEDFVMGVIREGLVDMDISFTPKISYEKHTRKITITPGRVKNLQGKFQYIYPSFSKLICKMIGINYLSIEDISYGPADKNGIYLEKGDTRSDRLTVFSDEMNMNAGMPSLYLYCDLIQPVVDGDQEVQLIRNVEIPNDTKFGDQIDIKYQTPYYYPIIRKEFDNIEINIKNDSNRTIDFKFGKTSLTFHFRKKKPIINESIYKLLK